MAAGRKKKNWQRIEVDNRGDQSVVVRSYQPYIGVDSGVASEGLGIEVEIQSSGMGGDGLYFKSYDEFSKLFDKIDEAAYKLTNQKGNK